MPRFVNPPNLISVYLQSKSYIPRPIDLYLITLADGVTKYYWSSYDKMLVVGSPPDTYLPQGPFIKRTKLSVKNTVEIPELGIEIYASDSHFIGGIAVKQQIHNGYFDGATVQLSRLVLLFDQSGNLVGSGNIGAYPGGMFTGKMGPAKLTAVGASFTVKAATVVFNQYVPKNTYQLQCVHTFCDTLCTLSAATYTITNTVGASPTRLLIPWGTAPGSPGKYSNGVLTMTSGAAVGQKRTVKFASASGLMLQYPLYNTPASGDAFSVIEGCTKNESDGSGQDCTARSNTQHFRGFPFVPTGENAV